MPRHDWHDDPDTMSRDSRWRHRDYDDRSRSAMFDREREYDRDYRDREPPRRPQDSWGGLMSDDDRRPRDRDIRSRRDDDRWFGSDDHNRGIPMDETKRLIASNKVEGTPVYDRHGDKLGTVHNFMVDKMSGRVAYAVLKHSSGFLGLGERYYPLEWDQLDYDTRLDGYHVNLDEEDLENFGSFDSEGRYRRRRIRSDRSRTDDRSQRW